MSRLGGYQWTKSSVRIDSQGIKCTLRVSALGSLPEGRRAGPPAGVFGAFAGLREADADQTLTWPFCESETYIRSSAADRFQPGSDRPPIAVVRETGTRQTTSDPSGPLYDNRHSAR